MPRRSPTRATRSIQGIAIILVAFAIALAVAQHRKSLPNRVTKQMTWTCHRDNTDIRTATPITLNFVTYPNLFITITTPGLCSHLQQAGRPQVPVLFSLTRAFSFHITGYHDLSVDGIASTRPYAGHSGTIGNSAVNLDQLMQPDGPQP